MGAQGSKRKVWVLDTETKGTGAHVVPYEKTLKAAGREQDLALVAFNGPSRPARAPQAPPPLVFKVVDVMGARVLAEGIGVRETVELLQRVRSALDVRVFVWVQDTGRWRLLTLEERKALWGFRGHVGSPEGVGA